MKQLKRIFLAVLSLSFVLLIAACREEILGTPTGLNMDETYTLYWRGVADARSYSLEIKNVGSGDTEYESSHRTYFSLESLSPGDYEVKIQAIGGSLNAIRSEWSEPLALHRERDSGLAYSPINGNTEYEVTKLGTAVGDVVIEEKYRGKPVTSIAESAFRGKGNTRITSVKVGENVTSIGASAFYNCTALKSVELPDGITFMGEAAFQGCTKLESINIPAQLTYLPAHVFNYCRALKHIELGDKIVSIGDSAFASCSSLTDIVIPDSVVSIGDSAFAECTVLSSAEIGRGIKYIDNYAFSECPALEYVNFPVEAEGLVLGNYVFRGAEKLISVALPEGTEEIGTYTFYRCSSLNEVQIPASVKKIGEFSFHDTALYQRQSGLGNGFVYADDWLVAVSPETKLTFTNLDASYFTGHEVYGIADNTFVTETEMGTTGCPELREITLPDSLRYIGEYAFYGCPRLTKVVTQSEASELVEIGNRAFQNCGMLVNVQFLGSKLKRVGNYAFLNCTTLGNNEDETYERLLPESVEQVGTRAFNGTSFYTSVASGDGVVYAGRWLVGTNNLTDSAITVKDGITGIADYAFYQCEALEYVSGNGSVRNYGYGAFMNCVNLQRLDRFNSGLTVIPDYLFSGCTSLTSVSADGDYVEFPRALTRIGAGAFENCGSLTDVILEDTAVTEIGDGAFYGCSGIAEVTFPETLERICDSAFYDALLIPEVVLPESLTELGASAFGGCSSLSSVTFGGNLEKIGDLAFSFCTSLQEISLPDNIRELGDYAFYQCLSLEKVSLGQVRTIGDYCFGVTPITEIRLPATLKHIGDRAFKSCYNLTSVLIEYDPSAWDPEDLSPPSVGIHAFLGCNRLTIYAASPLSVSEDWNNRWNSGFRPVVWGATLSEEGYVLSVTVGEENFSNPFARWGFTAPAREGYRFIGWSASENAAEAEYGVNDLAEVAPGTTLYAVYVPAEADE